MSKARGSKKARVADRPAGRRAEAKRSQRSSEDVVKRRTRRRLSDFAGILSPEAAEELREVIEEGRRERERLDRKRVKQLMEAFDRSDDTVVLERARRKAKSAGLTRKKVRDLVDEVKKEMWNRTYKDRSPRR